MALTFVQKIIAGSTFNIKEERNLNPNRREKASFSLLCLHSFLSFSFQRPRQTCAQTLATQATPERKFIYTLSSADRLSAAFL